MTGAVFTMLLREAIGYDGRDPEPSAGKPGIGLDTYPIFDEAYRAGLNAKIIDHYWNREIGQETISLFRFALRRKMNEIMPLYNQHYKLSLIQDGVDLLSTMSIRTIASADLSGTAEADGSSTSGSTSSGRTVSSDTPQTMLSGSEDYASAAADSNTATSGEGTSTEKRTTTDHSASESTTSGYQGHTAQLIYAARAALVNVDMLVIEELEGLFMQLWSNGDDFTGRAGTYNNYLNGWNLL